jgi:Holliday junction resolvasome RuvABC endonuclease subunit
MRIMAIDGALNHSGWVMLDHKEVNIDLVAKGIILPKLSFTLARKLMYLRKRVLELVKEYEPEEIVFEDTFAGQNALTTARLNNAKGVLLVTAYEALGKEPACVKATEARACLGFRNGKDPKKEPWEFFTKEYDLKLGFEAGNDITDACVLGWWYIKSKQGECKKKEPKPKPVKGKIKGGGLKNDY